MPADLTLLQVAIAVVVALASSFIRGLTGFGMALMLVPVLALTVTPEQAVVTANALGVVMGLASYRGARLAAEGSARTIALLGMLATPAGLVMLAVTPDNIARLVIALAALAAFVFVLRPGGGVRAAGSDGKAMTHATGIASGLLAGFAGMPGPPVIAFYLGRQVERAVARASMFLVFLATSISACVAALALGLADAKAAWLALILAPAVLIGNALGSLAFGRVNELAWRLFAGTIVAGAAVVAIARLL